MFVLVCGTLLSVGGLSNRALTEFAGPVPTLSIEDCVFVLFSELTPAIEAGFLVVDLGLCCV